MTNGTVDDLPNSKDLTTREVVRWWELRRPVFNLVLFVVGFCSVWAMYRLIEPLLRDGEDVIEPSGLLLVVTVYGVLVNGCYTLAWAIELWERKSDVRKARERAQLIFIMMLVVSAIMATGPLWFGCAFWMMNRH